MEYKIEYLPKETWKDTVLEIGYTTEQYYNVSVERTKDELKRDSFTIKVEKKQFDNPVTHNQEEYDYPDRLYPDYYPHACAWGVIVDGKLIAAIETEQEEWSNRLRVAELWVAPSYQKQGLGRALMNVAKEQARQEHRRAVILETQSCNVNAVDFYMHEGFTLIGFDSCAYADNDLDRKHVRLEMGWFPPRQ